MVGMTHQLPALLVLFLITFVGFAPAAEESNASVVSWGDLAPIPNAVGVAGPVAGVSNDALIVAGGANFPDARPWEGDTKVWYDAIYVLPRPDGEWLSNEGWKLTQPLAYAACDTWRRGVVFAGGGDAERHLRSAYLLNWNGSEPSLTPLPDLPAARAFSAGVIVDDVFYVAGGIEKPDATTAIQRMFALDLSKPSGERAWVETPPWPGPGRILPVLGTTGGEVYIFSGASLAADENDAAARTYLTDAYAYDAAKQDWRQVADLPHPVVAAPGPAAPWGGDQLAVFGGDDGALDGQMQALKDDHPGFPRRIHVYHAVTDRWRVIEQAPLDDRPTVVTTSAVPWRNDAGESVTLLPSGEARPGVRTPRVQTVVARSRPRSFGALNSTVVVAYLLALAMLGWRFASREASGKDFFLAGGRIPWWAAGLSIFGTQLSAITFMAIPAKSFAEDWLYLLGNFCIAAVAPLIAFFYLPAYRASGETTVYGYLERRFASDLLRRLSAATFVLLQLGRMGVVLCLPAVALAATTNLDVRICILVMGLLATAYTAAGGIEAVVWTDVLQVFVLGGGAIVCLIAALLGADASAVGEAVAFDKTRFALLSWDVAAPSLGVMLLGMSCSSLIPYAADQTVVQRYLTTANERDAARGVWTNAVLTIPASILFFGLGTALWCYYRSHVDQLDPFLPRDAIVPWFAATALPAPAAGVVIAGVFAAAMSSLDSSLNSMAAVILHDFARRRDEGAATVRAARRLTWLLGAAGVGSALYLAAAPDRSLWEQYLKIIGLTGGALAGVFTLGVFFPRVDARAALTGAASGVLATAYVWLRTDWHFLLYPAVGIGACVLVGVLTAAAATPADPRSG